MCCQERVADHRDNARILFDAPLPTKENWVSSIPAVGGVRVVPFGGEPLWRFSFACCGVWLCDNRCLRFQLRGDRSGRRGALYAGIEHSRAK
jgi:hypothetical protein